MTILNWIRVAVILVGFGVFALSWRLERFQWGSAGHSPIRDANAFSLRLLGSILVIVTLMTWVIAYGPVDFGQPYRGH